VIEPRVYKCEQGYLDLMSDILAIETEYPDRTGVGCKKVFGASLMFDLRESFPRTNVRKTPLRFAFEEWMFFMRGQTDTALLESKGINIWKGNTSREFLDERGMTGYHEGEMGKAYGWQFRNFGSHHNGEGVDQLTELYDNLRDNPFSRRHYVTFWNPAMDDHMALLPCFHSHQFHCEKTDKGVTLHLKVFSRSSDVLFGLPFNYMQYGFYLQVMAQAFGYTAGVLLVSMTDSHVYSNQYEYAQETVEREIHPQQKRRVLFHKELNSLDDILSMQWEDVRDEGGMVNVQEYKSAKPKMAV